jgi:NTP pyrophosphatase (non-canonical NTP hydrolase)
MDMIEEINRRNSEKYGRIHKSCGIYSTWCRCFLNNNHNNRNMTHLITKVVLWADEKNLLKPENSLKQFTKVVEEVGEVAAALAREDKEELKDGIGDVIVTLIILAEQQGLTLNECLNAAYNEIKDRTGKTINGAFVKAEDL